MAEKTKLNCSHTSNCYAIIALCIACLTLGLVIGNWIGKCQKSKKYNKSKKCQSYTIDGQAGSTCNWSKKDTKYPKECKKDSI